MVLVRIIWVGHRICGRPLGWLPRLPAAGRARVAGAGAPATARARHDLHRAASDICLLSHHSSPYCRCGGASARWESAYLSICSASACGADPLGWPSRELRSSPVIPRPRASAHGGETLQGKCDASCTQGTGRCPCVHQHPPPCVELRGARGSGGATPPTRSACCGVGAPRPVWPGAAPRPTPRALGAGRPAALLGGGGRAFGRVTCRPRLAAPDAVSRCRRALESPLLCDSSVRLPLHLCHPPP